MSYPNLEYLISKLSMPNHMQDNSVPGGNEILEKSIVELNEKLDQLTKSTADALLQISTALDAISKKGG